MMNNDFYQALQDCVTQARSGVSVEQCLSRHPRYADELRPLLVAATASQSQLSTGLSSAVRRRIRGRVMGYWDVKHSRKRTWSFSSFLPLRWAGAAAVLVLLVMVGGVGTVAASQNSVPGSALYPVKQLREDAGLWFASSPDEKVTIYSAYAQERASEIQKLAQQGDSAAISTSLSRLEQHLSAVDHLTEASPEAPAMESRRDSMIETLAGTLASTSQSGGVQEALAQSEEDAYPCVEHTLQILREARGRVGDAARKVGGSLTDNVGQRTAGIGTFCPP
jgi:hypothetical protein